MSGACCLIRSDLSRVLVTSAGASAASWRPADLGPDDVPTASTLAARASAAASWVAGFDSGALRKRLSAVCIDVDETRCRWVRPGGTAAPVVSAAVRGLDQDWDQAVLPERVETLVNDASPDEQAVAVISIPDALPRLFLDELDRRGAPAPEVLSLWHAMARAWDDDPASPGMLCVLLDAGDGRLVWSWSRAGALVVGGSAPMSLSPGAEDRAAKRVALDWLTWSVQVGASPDLIVAVGPGARKAAGALGDQWKGVAVRAAEVAPGVDGALATTLSRVAAAPEPAPSDARRTLTQLSRRPTRATRHLYRWGAFGIVCLAIGAGGLGIRMAGAASSTRAAADQTVNDARQRVVTALPLAGSQPSIDLYLQQRIAQLQQGTKFEPPPDPPPIFEEYQRILGVIQEREGVELTRIVLSGGATSELYLTVPDTRTGEELTIALGGANMGVAWAVHRSSGIGSGTQLIFKGAFR